LQPACGLTVDNCHTRQIGSSFGTNAGDQHPLTRTPLLCCCRRMVRALAQQLRPLLVQLNSFATGQGVAQYAVPAVAVPQSGGMFGSKRVTTPLSEPLPGVNMPNVAAPKAPELKVCCQAATHALITAAGALQADCTAGRTGVAPPTSQHSLHLVRAPSFAWLTVVGGRRHLRLQQLSCYLQQLVRI
jgi:hypothetical protein